MARNEVELTIKTDTKGATKGIKKFAKVTSSALSGIERSMSGLNVLAAGFVGVLGGRALISGISSLTQAASVQEDAINELNTALKIAGTTGDGASAGIQKFASELQNSSVIGDEAAISAAALIQSLGKLDEDGLKQATQASADLSAALGIDLRSAALLVGKAAAGEVSSFSRYGLVIKKGADNAATFKNALDGINDSFGGAAASKIATYSGASTQLSNVYGDLFESLGSIITQNPVVIGGIKELTKGFSALIGMIEDNKAEITAFISKGFKALINTLPAIISGIATMVKGLAALKFVFYELISGAANLIRGLLEIRSVSTVVNALTDTFKSLFSDMLIGIGIIADLTASIPFLKDKFPGLTKTIEDVSQSLIKMGLDAEESIGDDVAQTAIDNLAEIEQAAFESASGVVESFEPVDKALTALQGLAQGVADSIEAIPDTAQKSSEKALKQIETGFFDQLVEWSKEVGGNIFESIKSTFTSGEGIIGIINKSLKGGREGAVAIGSGIAGGIAAAIGGPAVGGAVATLFEQLSKGGAASKALISSTLENLPEVMVTVAEALAEVAPVFVEKFIEVMITEGGLVRIFEAYTKIWVAGTYKLAEALLHAMNDGLLALAKRFGINAIEAMPEPGWIKDIREWWGRFASEWEGRFQIPEPAWVQKFKESVDKLTNWSPGKQFEKQTGIDLPSADVKGAVRVGAAVITLGQSEVANEVGKRLGLADGGMVRNDGAFNLHAGEVVTPATTSQNLFKMIDAMATNGSGGGSSTEILLARILEKLSETMTVETTAQVDGNTLADIMLQLSRRNARTAA